MSALFENSGGGRFATSRKGGIDAYEAIFIQEKAARGVSAANIARMIGRAEADVSACMVVPRVSEPVCKPKKQTKPKVAARPPPLRELPRVVLSLYRGLIVVPAPADRVTMDNIARDVAFRYDVTVAELRGPSRRKHLIRPRQEAMWLMHEAQRWSLPQIGRYFGRDHTTVIYGVRKHAALIGPVRAGDLNAWHNLGAA